MPRDELVAKFLDTASYYYISIIVRCLHTMTSSEFALKNCKGVMFCELLREMEDYNLPSISFSMPPLKQNGTEAMCQNITRGGCAFTTNAFHQ